MGIFINICLTIISILFVLCTGDEIHGPDDHNAVNCNFQHGTCGWSTLDWVVGFERNEQVSVCGVDGILNKCYFTNAFQNGVPWTATQIKLIALNEFGFPANISKMVHKYDSMFVLGTANYIQMGSRQIGDTVSAEIPMSMEHRCLNYRHLVIGTGTSLVVAYIKDYFKPFDLSEYLNAHVKSSVIQFSSSSVILPVGVKFKLVFRAVFNNAAYGMILIDDISISDGICRKCSPEEFRCREDRDECIPLTKVCDFKPDCMDGEDERQCDFEILTMCCGEKQISASQNVSAVPDGELYVPRPGLCDNGRYNPPCASNNCSLLCPTNCTCVGLSYNCSSHNAPEFATSITLTGLNERYVVFTSSFWNLKEIKIISCELETLYIKDKVYLHTLTISHSNITKVFFDRHIMNLRYVSIIESSFDIFRPYLYINYRDVFTFELYVYKSSVLNTTMSEIPKLYGAHVNLSETIGFPYIIQSFNHLVVNFSFCNLTLQPWTYQKTITLDLSHNRLKKWHILSFIQILHLQHNLIETVNFTFDLRHSEARLQYLDLSHNYMSVIEEEDFIPVPNLLYLKIRNNRLINVHDKALSFVSNLFYLDLSNNYLRSLKRSHFIQLSNLQYLYLQNNNLKVIEGMFDGLMNIQYLQVDSYTLCCAQPKAADKIHCSAPLNEISSCHSLIDTPLLSVIIWYIALLAVFGNFLGIIYRGLVVKTKLITSFDIYSINLGFADLLMGVYLYIIAGANLMFSGRYGFEDDSWRNSPYCTFAGVLATLSSEASALFVLSITIDRILIIRFPFSKLKLNGSIVKIITIFVWITAILLSVLPLSGSEYFNGYYASSGICVSLPLSVLRKPGWEYSMILFVGANFLIFMAILLGQFVIFTDVLRMGKEVNSKRFAQKRREIELAKTLIAVAVTDMLCWIPIGVIGLLTFFGIDVTAKVYSWVIVVVLPINSALNPIIYTFSAMLRRRRQQNFSKTSSYSKTREEKYGEIFQVMKSSGMEHSRRFTRNKFTTEETSK